MDTPGDGVTILTVFTAATLVEEPNDARNDHELEQAVDLSTPECADAVPVFGC